MRKLIIAGFVAVTALTAGCANMSAADKAALSDANTKAESAQQTADQALTAAKSAQSKADTAYNTAEQALAAAQAAQKSADEANERAKRMLHKASMK